MTGSSAASRRTMRFIGGSSWRTEARLSQSSQLGQFRFSHRVSSETLWVTSLHSAVSQGVRTEMKARWASKTKTARASPPLQPIPATMADESRTAMGFTPFPLYPGDNLHDLAYRLNFTRPISVDL